MGYEVHITRREDWSDEDGPLITLDEWLAYVEADPEMRGDGYAEAKAPDGSVLRVDDPGIAVWTAWSKHGEGGGMAWFSHFEDRISFKNPDVEVLRKMHQIAVTLDAMVQGDDGELYDAKGESDWQEIGGPPVVESMKKPWWKFWE